MDEPLQHALRGAALAAGVQPRQLPSGAGHDAATFANAGVPAGMIFIRNDHGSHNPDEKMDLDDFIMGTEVLYQAVSAEPETLR
jgi:N-carbamoyl-L-amino-acid hydrolase